MYRTIWLKKIHTYRRKKLDESIFDCHNSRNSRRDDRVSSCKQYRAYDISGKIYKQQFFL